MTFMEGVAVQDLLRDERGQVCGVSTAQGHFHAGVVVSAQNIWATELARWTGVYDVTPDWIPVLVRVPDVPGLVVGCGFSGHGFKLSPVVGRVPAQEALGLPTNVPLAPYALERFRSGRLLTRSYGSGAVS